MRRRALLRHGMAGVVAAGLAPAVARAEPRKLALVHMNAPPEPAAVAFSWQADEVRKRSDGELDLHFFGSTLLDRDIEIMDAVRSGAIAIGNPGNAAATVFPEMGAFQMPYVVQSYDHAYGMLNGAIGDRLDQRLQEKYKLKILCFFDYGFRHFWTGKKPIVEPADLQGAKMRVPPAKMFSDTIQALGGSSVPLALTDVLSAVQDGAVDGGDMTIANMLSLKIYRVAKYCSMSFHSFGATFNVMNLGIWSSLSAAHKQLLLDTSREAQEKCRQLTEASDSLAGAGKELEPQGMTVVPANVEAFRKAVQEKVWPAYSKQYGDLWDEIMSFKA
jgi:tripartite ATP-independent transporter DctP family solute receptor